MASTDGAAIERLMDELSEAWRRGDAEAYGRRYRPDATFTNVNGTFFIGREEFDRRHREIFRGVFKDTTVTMTMRKLRFLRPDIAVWDGETRLSGLRAPPSGAQTGRRRDP
jgi:uncharacterized protein (TIGR02246 family)